MTHLPHFLAGLILVGTVAALSIPDSSTIAGPATTIDGDTIQINKTRIRLWGIDAPERSQPQGPAATNHLRGLTSDIVTCTRQDTDRYGRIVARCATMGQPDIGRAMVVAGHALDYTRYSRGYYADAEREARAARRGIHAGAFVNPEMHRAGKQTR